MRHLISAVLMTMSICVLCGCGSPAKDPLGRQAVTGKVTLDGKPIDAGSISFQPIAESGPATASGAVITSGQYKIPAESGLAPGEYRVVILSPEPEAKRSADEMMNNPSATPSKERVAAKFNKDTELKATIKSNSPNVADFAVTGEK
ncbi:MAG: hypothetical protein JWP89_5093 [Schlesneria sp.]|nr:hypothetical protein [Schlesneria sp.]